MTTPDRGALSIILHAHLPYIRHEDHPDFLEEDWLFEAITETYLPLLQVFDRLNTEQIPFRMSMTLSPTLCEMLADPLLQERYERWLGRKGELAEQEVRRCPPSSDFHEAAGMYCEFYTRAHLDFTETYQRNLVRAFRRLQDRQRLEILTCAATHGFLPLMSGSPAAAAQIKTAVKNYQKHFYIPPRGIWLPECGYAEGIDDILVQAGIRYTILDTHGVLNGEPSPEYGVWAPVRTGKGLYILGRDPESSKQVWSAQEGYPGDPLYREFYRDLGYDADLEYIRPYLHSDGVRRNVGFKYHRITGPVPLNEKAPYVPAWARARAVNHARHFVSARSGQAERLSRQIRRAPLIVAPYDAELFGHWWFEGPVFIEHVLRASAGHHAFSMVTLSEYLAQSPDAQRQQPSPSTWGDKGYNEVWLNGSNDWVYRHAHQAEQRMTELARNHSSGTPPPLLIRALSQAAREVLLAQSSDWAFLMTTGTAVSYAHRRFKEHINRFTMVYNQIREGKIDETALAQLERTDPIFPEIDFRVFA